MTKSGSIQEKSIRLFTYLRELSELRSKITRTLDTYDEVLWFDDIPQETECRCIDWTEREDEEVEAWIEIHKPRLLSPPKLPGELEVWVNPSDLKNSANKLPILREEVLVLTEDDNSDETIQRVEKLEDHPEIQARWDSYIQEAWMSWAEEDRRRQRVQRTYNRLFSIYQRQQRLGEAYEVVVGVGLLDWQPPSGKPVRRHLVTAQASLDFDAARGVIAVVPGAEGARLALEQDMLEPSERPQLDAQKAVEELIQEMQNDLLDQTS